MTAVTAPASNGAGNALTPREQLLEQARAQADVLVERREELAAELAGVDRDLKAYERAITALDPAAVPPVKRRGPGRPSKNGPARTVPSKVGPERLAQFEAAVRELGANDREFRQIDVLRHLGENKNSGLATNAFEQLREANVIRFARQQRGPGGGKFFRLTRPALREGSNA